ncbi:MAG: MarR family transcriptional regulator [Actinomycetota bacterium]|nr:MarR family transcriptional regulator [Actinomycetota bacterium]
MSTPRTHVAEIVSQWNRERPDLDASPMLVIGQMARLTQLFEPHLRPPFAAVGLGNGDFDVLAALRRAGEPFMLTPGQLATSLLVTTGAITKRLDRLEARGLVRRTVSGADGRGRLVNLTTPGFASTDELIAAHLVNEARLLSALDDRERNQLATLLDRLAEALEAPQPEPAGPTHGELMSR